MTTAALRVVREAVRHRQPLPSPLPIPPHPLLATAPSLPPPAAASPSPSTPPSISPPLLPHPRPILRVFSLPGLTPFVTSYLLQKRLTAHRIGHSRSVDSLLSHLSSLPHLSPPERARLSHAVRAQLSAEEKAEDVLILSEPTVTYTLGRNASLAHVRLPDLTPLPCTDIPSASALLSSPSSSPPLLRLDRGGEVTYHGPGQLLAYPLIDLHHLRPDLHLYLRLLERVIIASCHALGLSQSTPVTSDPAYTGVWRGGRKLCAIGVGCSRWHTLHGLALNVDVDLRAYDPITPCGISDVGRGVGNVRAELEREGGTWPEDGMARTRAVVVEQFGQVMGFDVRWSDEPLEPRLQRWDEGA